MIAAALMLPLLCIGCSRTASLPAVAPSQSDHAFSRPARATLKFRFRALTYPQGTATFCLGLSDRGVIVGFAVQQQAKGIEIQPPYGPDDYSVEDYPHAVDSAVTGVTADGDTSGFWIDPKGITRGFVRIKNIFSTYKWGIKTRTTELLGLNHSSLAVGFYEDAAGADKAFELALESAKGYRIHPPKAVSAAATGINAKGDVVGWERLSDGSMRGWLLKSGVFTVLQYPGANQTEALSVNSEDDIVGIYSGSDGKTHGFLLVDPVATANWKSIDEPHAGAGATTAVTGINDHDTIVGWFVNRHGKTSGFVATPK